MHPYPSGRGAYGSVVTTFSMVRRDSHSAEMPCTGAKAQLAEQRVLDYARVHQGEAPQPQMQQELQQYQSAITLSGQT